MHDIIYLALSFTPSKTGNPRAKEEIVTGIEGEGSCEEGREVTGKDPTGARFMTERQMRVHNGYTNRRATGLPTIMA